MAAIEVETPSLFNSIHIPSFSFSNGKIPITSLYKRITLLKTKILDLNSENCDSKKINEFIQILNDLIIILNGQMILSGDILTQIRPVVKDERCIFTGLKPHFQYGCKTDELKIKENLLKNFQIYSQFLLAFFSKVKLVCPDFLNVDHQSSYFSNLSVLIRNLFAFIGIYSKGPIYSYIKPFIDSFNSLFPEPILILICQDENEYGCGRIVEGASCSIYGVGSEDVNKIFIHSSTEENDSLDFERFQKNLGTFYCSKKGGYFARNKRVTMKRNKKHKQSAKKFSRFSRKQRNKH